MNINFEITVTKNCPLYEVGDHFALSGKSFASPTGKDACLILVRDLTGLLFQLPNLSAGELEEKVFNCSGCVGLMKYCVSNNAQSLETDQAGQASLEDIIYKEYGSLITSSFLRAVPIDKQQKTFNYLGLVEVTAGTPLITKGQKNTNIYLLLSGKLAVENEGFVLAILGAGDICGEMSYLGAETAVASVRAVDDCRLLAISCAEFEELFHDISSVQLFMAQLMSQRLAQNNEDRAQAFTSCMTGRIDKTSPAELLQIFNMNQKTGVLDLDVLGVTGHIVFSEGNIVKAEYGGEQGKAAIFAMLKAKRGVYRFATGITEEEKQLPEIGEFMNILMEGVQYVDEEI